MTLDDKEQQRKERKAKKRALKETRVAKASDPAHQLSKLTMVERTRSVAQAQEAARLAEEERIDQMRIRHRRWMRARFLEEVDSDGEPM